MIQKKVIVSVVYLSSVTRKRPQETEGAFYLARPAWGDPPPDDTRHLMSLTGRPYGWKRKLSLEILDTTLREGDQTLTSINRGRELESAKM